MYRVVWCWGHFPEIFVLIPLTAVTAIWQVDVIVYAATYQTHPDKFLAHFNTQCAYSET